MELLGIFSLLFQISWVGMILSIFGRKIEWVLAVSIPFIGAISALVYSLISWKNCKLNEKLFGLSYFITFVVSSVLMLNLQADANSAEPGNINPPVETNSVSPIPFSEDQLAALEAEMRSQTLEANLANFKSVETPLSGEWARISDNKLFELVNITTESGIMKAVRTTVDSRIPQGEIIWKADLSSGEFQIRVAEEKFQNPKWIEGAVSQFSTNIIVVLPLYDGEKHRPFANGNELEMVYIPKPQNVE